MNSVPYSLSKLSPDQYISLLDSGKTLIVKKGLFSTTHIKTLENNDIPKGYRKATAEDIIKISKSMIPRIQNYDLFRNLRSATSEYAKEAILIEKKEAKKFLSGEGGYLKTGKAGTKVYQKLDNDTAKKEKAVENFNALMSRIAYLMTSYTMDSVEKGKEHAIGASQVKELLKLKVNPNLKIGDTTLLHTFASIGGSKAVKKLCKNGADISITDSNGETPLVVAVKEHKLLVVKVLVKYKPDKRDIEKVIDHVKENSAPKGMRHVLNKSKEKRTIQ